MKIKSLYISSLYPSSGSSVVSMGFMEILRRNVDNIAFFRPIVRSKNEIDTGISFMLEHYGLNIEPKDASGFSVEEIESAIANGVLNELLQKLIESFKSLEKKYDFIICEGYPRTLLSSLDFDINLEFAKNLDIPLVNLLNGKNRTNQEIIDEMNIESRSIKKAKCSHFATFINFLEKNNLEVLKNLIKDKNSIPTYLIPEIDELSSPTIGEIKNALDCDMLFGKEEDLRRVVKNSKVVAMSVENALVYLGSGDLIITPGDRTDVILSTIMANDSSSYPTIAGIILSGGLVPKDTILKLLNGFDSISLPILCTSHDTLETAIKIKNVPAKIRVDSERKIALSMGLFSSCVNTDEIADFIDTTKISSIMTPIMFEYNIFENARKHHKRIVLPESDDPRILRATEILLRREVVEVILLGDEAKINRKAASLGVDISKATIINPKNSTLMQGYIEEFYNLRKHKGVSLELASDTVHNFNYFATMMVHKGDADGMVSGATHTTGDTIRPALQIIKTKPGISIVSSIFFMCLDTRVLVYGDCAVNQEPTALELAQIAISSAQTAVSFGINPNVAMLSYSTGFSGSGDEVEKVREATKIAKELNPDLLIEGPIQYDAAIDPNVAKTKLPNSKVAGNASVFIFPDLNTGNNTYKAVQRSSGAIAIGPVLQGLKKPVNDLSRGCTVADIVNTVAITAIQAGTNK